MHVKANITLTETGAAAIMSAAIANAAAANSPQCIAIVDSAGHLLSFVRMEGAKLLSIDTAIKKAVTAAMNGKPTGSSSPEMEIKMALGTNNKSTNVRGGLPIIMDGQILGGIGVGSGTLDEDVACAQAGLKALETIE